MSVILTACRHSRQRAVERALKKRAEKHRLKREAELMQLEQDTCDDIVKDWTFMMNNSTCCVVLCLPSGKDTVEIYYNEEEVRDVMTNVSAEGATFDFVIEGTYKARISCCGDPSEGLTHILTIDGNIVPESPE